jgi:hypothetical protein
MKRRISALAFTAVLVGAGIAGLPSSASAAVPGAVCHLSFDGNIMWSACDYTPVNAYHWVDVLCADGTNQYDSAGYHPGESWQTTYSSGINIWWACIIHGGYNGAHYTVDPA